MSDLPPPDPELLSSSSSRTQIGDVRGGDITQGDVSIGKIEQIVELPASDLDRLFSRRWLMIGAAVIFVLVVVAAIYVLTRNPASIPLPF